MKKRVLSLILITVLVYIGTLGHDFQYDWDDHWVVINDYTTAGFTFSNLWHILTDFYRGQYAPFNELSYVFVHALFGYSPMAFHAMSIIWHTANVVLVFFLVRSLLCHIHGAAKSASYDNIAWLAALLWAVHPMNVESVAWVSASKILVYAFFYLLALLLYLKYIESPTIAKYIGLVLLFVASFFGKEQAVVLPLAFLLFDYAMGRKESVKYLLIEKLPFFILAVFLGVVTIISQGYAYGVPEYPLDKRLFFAGYTLFEYLVKSVLPVNLSYLYPFPCAPDGDIPVLLYAYPVILLALGYFVYMQRKHRVLVVGILFFVIHLLVAIHLISTSRFAVVADRYNYVAMIGPMMIITVSLSVLYHRRKAVALCLRLVYFAYLCTYTLIYQRRWVDSKTLKATTEAFVSTGRNENHKILKA